MVLLAHSLHHSRWWSNWSCESSKFSRAGINLLVLVFVAIVTIIVFFFFFFSPFICFIVLLLLFLYYWELGFFKFFPPCFLQLALSLDEEGSNGIANCLLGIILQLISELLGNQTLWQRHDWHYLLLLLLLLLGSSLRGNFYWTWYYYYCFFLLFFFLFLILFSSFFFHFDIFNCRDYLSNGSSGSGRSLSFPDCRLFGYNGNGRSDDSR